ncbi:MAG: DUF3136 domain-containing protein [Caldilineaceae bacterium]|nr:DUF3136 domain-containing protein [Caldilineaceae bacterium]
MALCWEYLHSLHISLPRIS